MRFSLLLPTLLLGASSASGQALERPSLPFPMDHLGTPEVAGTREMRPDFGAFAFLAGQSEVRLTGVTLADGQVFDLDLTRVRIDHAAMGMFVDGVPQSFDAGDQSIWKGQIAGQQGTDAFLTFASYGSYGWVHDGARHHHLMPFVEEGLDWSQASARWVPEDVLLAAGPRTHPVQCLADQIDSGPVTYESSRNPIMPDADAGSLSQSHGLMSTLECKMAVETDFQFYQIWGNLTAAQNYLTSLLAAMSDRYETTVDVVITYPYVQLYTSSNDPWTAQSGGAGAMLDQFRNAWAGNIPGGANLAHFMSGAGLGGGVAYVDVLCNQNFGFAVSGNLNGGVNFPVTQGSNTWDFVVTAHETGHNFGTSHTHNYCPTPLDECAASQYFGQCQSSRNCVSNGTIMSYCHTCSGGMNNITTLFHPQVATVMRNEAVNSCLPPYTGGGCTDDAMEPNDGCFTPAALGAGSTSNLKSCDANQDYYAINVAAGETLTVDALFLHANGDLDLELQTEFCLVQLDSSVSTTNNEQVSWTNTGASAELAILRVYMAAGAGDNDYDLFVDLEVIDPCPGPDDVYEPNDSCAEATPIENIFGSAWVEVGDADYYELCVNAGANLSVDLYFQHGDGDVDADLYLAGDCGGSPLVSGLSSSDNESFSYSNTSGVAQTYVLAVYMAAGSSSDCNDYVISTAGAGGDCSTIGTNFCDPAVVNSTGLSGVMSALGSDLVIANDFTVVASNLPVGQPGYFLGSQSTTSVPMAGGSQGTLCVGAPTARFVNQVGAAGASGQFSAQLDLSSFPTNPSQPVLAGQTWHFQLWHRDFNPGPTSNFTNGLSVIFN